ncbi:MAG: PTS sugar transporter subunit IIA [Acidobacteriota bacterium]|nr:PTS sugar transporter subunit IIA [Acidobacteriota bacterium]
MRINGFLKDDHILLDLKPGNKEFVLKEFVSVLKKKGLISNDKIVLRELLKRERLGSTGITEGIAVPHALLNEFYEPFLAIAKIKEGVNFESLDKKPTHILFLLLGDKKNPGLQLKTLAHICRLIKETKFVERIKKATSSGEIRMILEEEEGKIA